MSNELERQTKSSGSKLSKRTLGAIATLFSLFLLMFGLIAAELYARHIGKFQLWRYPLQRVTFSEADRLKTYNALFYKQRHKSFAQWPIEVPTFAASKPAPRYLFKPNLRITVKNDLLEPAKNGDKVYWSSNSWGFRGPEFPLEKKEGTIRIVCLGASTTEGVGLLDDETYPFFLQQELANKFPGHPVEVINAGHHAFDIDDLLELLRQRILPLKPDVVLFYEATNNIYFAEFIKDVPATCPGDCWIESSWKRFLYSRSAYFDLMAERFHWIEPRSGSMPHTFDDALPKRSVTHYREGLKQIVVEAKQNRTTIVLSSFLTLAHEGLTLSHEQHPELAAWFEKYHYPYTPAEVARIYDLFNQQSREVAHDFNVPYAEVGAGFPLTPENFPHDLVHLSPEGNRLLAHAFAQFLERSVLPGLIKDAGSLKSK